MLVTTSTFARLSYYVPRALFEEVVFRLGGVSLLAWLGMRTIGRPALSWWLAIIAAQCINLALVLPVPAGPLALLYDGIRFLAPGLVWGWLYWRRGILAAAGAHTGAQILLQPALTMLFHW